MEKQYTDFVVRIDTTIVNDIPTETIRKALRQEFGSMVVSVKTIDANQPSVDSNVVMPLGG